MWGMGPKMALPIAFEVMPAFIRQKFSEDDATITAIVAISEDLQWAGHSTKDFLLLFHLTFRTVTLRNKIPIL